MTINVYYHIWAPADTDLWRLVVDEQLKRLYKSGLVQKATVQCAINGAQASRIKQFVSLYDWVNIIDCSDTNDEHEGSTMKHLYEDFISGRASKVLYFHTKGISHFGEMKGAYPDRRARAVNSWRHFMEWGCIDKWQENLIKLDHYHVTGVNYCLEPWPHISDNFWWVRADYINTLIHPTEDQFPRDSRDFRPRARVNLEKWIGLNHPSVFSFYNAPSSYDRKGFFPDVQPTSPGEPNWFWLYRDDIYPHYLKEP